MDATDRHYGAHRFAPWPSAISLEQSTALFGGNVHFMAAPWTERRGGRHGLEIRSGMFVGETLDLGIGYRWFPARLNRRRVIVGVLPVRHGCRLHQDRATCVSLLAH